MFRLSAATRAAKTQSPRTLGAPHLPQLADVGISNYFFAVAFFFAGAFFATAFFFGALAAFAGAAA